MLDVGIDRRSGHCSACGALSAWYLDELILNVCSLDIVIGISSYTICA